MKSLLLDIGNTRTKVAISNNGDIVEQKMLGVDASAELAALCERYRIEGAIASVVGPMPDFKCLIPVDIYSRFHLLSHNSHLPITIDYDTPETLGMDRVAAVVGASVLCPDSPLVVVDAGSCITIDYLDATNHYRGGAILPGINMRFKAMNQFTAALPLVTLSDDELRGAISTPMTGRSTRDSLVSGVCNAAIYEIEGFMRDYEKLSPGVKLFLTGGDAVFFANRLFFPNFANSNLLFMGLDKILEMNI